MEICQGVAPHVPKKWNIMKNLPSIIIVTDRGHLIAYRTTENDSLQRIESTSFAEGEQKISEIVTDQAGAFGMSGTPGTGSAERMGLVAELEMRCFRQIAEKIAEILDKEIPGRWGFASSSEINGAILDGMDEKYRQKLSINLRANLTNSPPADIFKQFSKAEAAHVN